MRRTLLILGLAVALVLGLLWALGGLAWIERLAMEAQREVQGRLAGAIRALRAGQPGALAALVAVAFGYGVVHAAGPGHGKLLIGAYGMASRVRLAPLAAIALAASLAQAAAAVALVYAGVWLAGWTRERLIGVADEVMLPLSHAAFAGIGLWLVWRGTRALARDRAAVPAADHGQHGHAAHVHGPDCGHRHGPTAEEIAQVAGLRDAALLVGGIALRPCTGAVFLLLLTWQMGIGPAGVLGAFAIGLGTATVTLAVAGMSVWAREGAVAALPGTALLRALPLVQIAIGGLVATIATDLLLRSL
jgi:ABC-type nickel/cobalt efflux system permease component RcnA